MRSKLILLRQYCPDFLALSAKTGFELAYVFENIFVWLSSRSVTHIFHNQCYRFLHFQGCNHGIGDVDMPTEAATFQLI